MQLARTRTDNLLFPALFALGAALPWLLMLVLLSCAGGSMRSHARQIDRVDAVLAGDDQVGAGLHNTVVSAPL